MYESCIGVNPLFTSAEVGVRVRCPAIVKLIRNLLVPLIDSNGHYRRLRVSTAVENTSLPRLDQSAATTIAFR